MADTKPDQPNNKPKRRLKAAPTLREQVAQTQQTATKPRKPSRVASVFRRVFGSALFRPFGVLFGALGRVLAAVWRSPLFLPVRFIARLLGKLLFVSYFRGAWQELRQVTWPAWGTSWRLTGAVLAFAIVFGLFIAGLDFVLEKAFREVLLGA